MFNFFNNQNNSVNNENKIDKSNMMDNFADLQKARKDLIGEWEAIMQYDEHIHSSTNRLAVETWQNIKDEELVHSGELLSLIMYLDPSQKQFIEKGIAEFNERMNTRG